jgi:thymidine kinase
MFSGKTTRMIERLRAAPIGTALAIRNHRDKRYSCCEVRTHTGEAFPARTVCHASEIPAQIPANTTLVAIDEGHFYDATLVDVCRQLVHDGRHVVITTLDHDMWGRDFAVIEQLRAIATTVTVAQAICKVCGAPATRTQRTQPLAGKCLVGGPEAFEPRCAACWTPAPEPPVDPEDAE